MIPLPAMPSRLTHAEVPAYLAQCESAWNGGGAGAAMLDASALHDFDSSAVAVLLELRRMAQARQVTIDVQGLPPRVRELATLYGVGELLAG